MSNSSVISLKLLIDTEAKRVLFAEAGVDFLFYILTLPVSKLISLVGKDGMVGSLPNLYESVENLNDSYIQPNQTRDSLLKHHCVSAAAASFSVPLVAINEDNENNYETRENKLCRCKLPRAHRHHSAHFYDNTLRVVCRYCGKCIVKPLDYVDYPPPPASTASSSSMISGVGFVKEVVTYMVMDDLAVKPMSTISSITLLNQLGVKDVCALQEKVVSLGMNEAVELLKASLETKNVLTRVFIKDLGSSSTVDCDQRDIEEVAVACSKRLRRHSSRRRRQGSHSRFLGVNLKKIKKCLK